MSPTPPTPGYSGKPLAQKLGLKPGHRLALAGAPRGFVIPGLPAGVVRAGPAARALDMVLLFVPRAAGFEAAFARQARRLVPAGMLWVAWPKKASGVPTDVTEDLVRRVGLGHGLVDVKICAVDTTWSGLKFVRRLADRERRP